MALAWYPRHEMPVYFRRLIEAMGRVEQVRVLVFRESRGGDPIESTD